MVSICIEFFANTFWQEIQIPQLVRLYWEYQAKIILGISSRSENYENVLSYPLKEAREKFEKNYLTSQLKKHKGNISKTAEFVGMERSALHRKLKTLGIKGVN